MPIFIEKKELTDLLYKSFPFIASKTSHQILSNFKITCENNYLTITATDLDQSITISTEIKNKNSECFDIAINARKIFDIVKELPEGDLTISVSDNIFTLKSEGGFCCKIAANETREYPKIPKKESLYEFSIDPKIFSSIVKKTVFAVSKDSFRACLCGVLLELDEKSFSMVATDGHRLGKSKVYLQFGKDKNIKAIFSPRCLQNIVKLIDAEIEKTNFNFSIGEKYAWIQAQKAEICAKLIEGVYPDYQRAIPLNNPKKAICNRRMLIDSLRRVCIFSNTKTNLVKFSFSAGELSVFVLNEDIASEARDILPIEYEGPSLNIWFNGLYFSEILSLIDSDRVRIEMNTETSACLLFPHQKADHNESEDVFLVMPLRRRVPTIKAA